jgi:hypothetical protein
VRATQNASNAYAEATHAARHWVYARIWTCHNAMYNDKDSNKVEDGSSREDAVLE